MVLDGLSKSVCENFVNVVMTSSVIVYSIVLHTELGRLCEDPRNKLAELDHAIS